jgi:hypothetical protein
MAGTWTYAGTAAGSAITSARDKVRLALGDTDASAPLLYDEELDVWLGTYSSDVDKTTAAAAQALATRFARYYDFETDGQKFARAQMSKQYAELAKSLKNKAVGLAALDTVKKDGYSTDVETSDVRSSADVDVRQNFYVIGGADAAP